MANKIGAVRRKQILFFIFLYLKVSIIFDHHRAINVELKSKVKHTTTPIQRTVAVTEGQ